MARVRRHKHHSRKSRSNWAVTGAFVAATTLSSGAARVDARVDATDLHRRLESLRVAVPGDTRAVHAASAQTVSGDQRRIRFDIPAGPLREVLAAIERTAGITIAIADDGIGVITSSGVTGIFTPLEAITRALEGTSVTARATSPNAVSLEIRLAAESVDVAANIPMPKPSSPKYATPMIDVPQTIEIIPRDVMDAQGVTTLSEALRNVPGISLQAGEGGGASNTSGDMFNLRGFSANNSVFVDGVRDDGLMSRDVFNIEQVEVFMGPTGSDVGRGNAAGYVNMQTKTPLPQSTYAVTYAYGSADQNRTTIDLNQQLPLADETRWFGRTALRLNAVWEDGGVPGRDVVRRKNQAIAPSIALGMNTSTRVSAAAQVTRQNNVPDYGVPGAAWRSSPLAPTTVLAEREVNLQNYYGSVGYDFDHVDQHSYTARIEHDVNRGLTVRNQSRYNQTHRTAVISTAQNPASFDPLSQTVAIARQANERRNRILSNQTSVSTRFGAGRVRHSASAGLEIASEEQFAPALAGAGMRAPVDLYNPHPFDAITGYNPVRTAASSLGRTNTVGAYAFDTIDIGNRWQINGGARVERYEADFTVVDASNATTTALTAADTLISAKAGVLYRVADSANVYFSYGSAVTPPGTANFTLSAQPNNQNNPNVRPQESTNYEIGGKVGFGEDRLSFSVSVFRTENENVIFTVDAAAIPPVFNQDDKQRVSGVAIGALGRLAARWQVLASFGYLDSRQISQNPVNHRKRLALTPAVSGSVWTTYDLPRGFTVGGGARYMDELFVNAANTIRVPGYTLVDALVEYDVNEHLSLRLNVNNVANSRYIKNVNNNGGRFNPGAPRSAVLTSSVRF